MKYLLTISVLFLSFSADISFADEGLDGVKSNDAVASEESQTNAPNSKAEETILTDKEKEFLNEAKRLTESSKMPANDLIAFMKDKHMGSSVAKKLKQALKELKYGISEKPGGVVSISYSKGDRVQADDNTNTSYIGKVKKAQPDCIQCHYCCSNMTNDDIAIRIQNLDKTMRLVSSDIGLLNDSIISTKITLDGIVHNLNNIIGYIQMTDGYKWQSFLQNSQIEKNTQLPKEYIVSMDNLSKTLNDMSIVLKQSMEQKVNVQPQVIQQPCQQINPPQYIDNLNKTIGDLSIMLQHALKREDIQDKQQCQSCLINEQINKAKDDKAAREHTESLESLNKTLLGLSEKLNAVINHKHDNHNVHEKSAEHDTLAHLNASLLNISNELQKVTNKMDVIDGKDVNITVIGQGALKPSNTSDDINIVAENEQKTEPEIIDKIVDEEHAAICGLDGHGIPPQITTIPENPVETTKDDVKTQEEHKQPETPTTPENPGEPTKDDVKTQEEHKQPETPTTPENPVEPTKEDVEKKDEHKQPETPTNPENPGEPTKEDVEKKDEHKQPETPITPENPGEPTKDDVRAQEEHKQPETPTAPENPVEPTKDDTENKPVATEEAKEVKQPETPTIPENPGEPTKDDTENKPVATEEAKEVKQPDEPTVAEKSEKNPADEPKNLGIVKQEIAAFEKLIENKGPEAGHNGIINNNSDTSKYDEIKTDLEDVAKKDDKELTSSNVPPPPPLLPTSQETVKEKADKKSTPANDPHPQAFLAELKNAIKEKQDKNLTVPAAPPLLVEEQKVDKVIDKEAEKEAAYDKFLEKRRLERERELAQISGIDDENEEKTSVTTPTPPPAPALDLSKVPTGHHPLKITKKSSTENHTPQKKLGIVAEMAKRFDALNKNGASQADHNGIVKKDSHTSGYHETKQHIKKNKKHK